MDISKIKACFGAIKILFETAEKEICGGGMKEKKRR